MHDVVEQHRDRLMVELQGQGVEVSASARRRIDELFLGADEAFSQEPERVEELADNTDRLVEALASASARQGATDADWGDGDISVGDGRPRRRLLDVAAVRRVILADCLWPFCREDT
jgi:hypothetical protein